MKTEARLLSNNIEWELLVMKSAASKVAVWFQIWSMTLVLQTGHTSAHNLVHE